MNHPEYNLQKSICQYLDLAYPRILYMSDTIASVKLTKQQAVRNKAIQKKDFKCPDLIIFKPNGTYHGMFLELKVESPYYKDGSGLKADKHIHGQAETMNTLSVEGYFCSFAWTFDQAKTLIDNYLKS